MVKKLPEGKEDEVIDLIRNTCKTFVEIGKITGVSCSAVHVINCKHDIRKVQKKRKTPFEQMAWRYYDEVKEAEEHYKKNRENRPKIRIDDSSVWMKK